MCCSDDSSTAREVCWGGRARPTTHPKPQPQLQLLLPYPPHSWQGWLGGVHHPVPSPASAGSCRACTARQAGTGMLRWLHPHTHTWPAGYVCVCCQQQHQHQHSTTKAGHFCVAQTHTGSGRSRLDAWMQDTAATFAAAHKQKHSNTFLPEGSISANSARNSANLHDCLEGGTYKYTATNGAHNTLRAIHQLAPGQTTSRTATAQPT